MLVQLPMVKVRDEWIRGDLSISDVLAMDYTPKSIAGRAEVVVMGCRAHPDVLLDKRVAPMLLAFIIVNDCKGVANVVGFPKISQHRLRIQLMVEVAFR